MLQGLFRRSARRLAVNPLVPGRGAIDYLERKEDERDAALANRSDLVPLRKPQVDIPSKAYRPLSLKAREDIMEAASHHKIHVVVDDESFGQRLDEFVLAKYPHLTASKLRPLVERGEVYRYRFNGKRRYTRMTDRLERGEMVVLPPSVLAESATGTALAGDEQPQVITEDDIRREQSRDGTKRYVSLSGKVREEALKWVVFKNKHVIVLNKPSGVPINGGTKVGLNVADMLPAWKFSNGQAPLLCHRLDQDTSGLLVLARYPDAQKMIGRMFVRRSVPNSVYWGFLTGKPQAKFGRIRMHLEVNKENGATSIVARAVPTPTSRAAIAEYVVNASALEYGSFVSFYPLTSQSSQIRIMAAHGLGCPVLGDARFGGEAAFPKSLGAFWDPDDKGLPLHLHHRKIQLPYKNGRGEFETVTAPMPKHMHNTFKKLGWPTEADDPLITG